MIFFWLGRRMCLLLTPYAYRLARVTVALIKNGIPLTILRKQPPAASLQACFRNCCAKQIVSMAKSQVKTSPEGGVESLTFGGSRHQLQTPNGLSRTPRLFGKACCGLDQGRGPMVLDRCWRSASSAVSPSNFRYLASWDRVAINKSSSSRFRCRSLSICWRKCFRCSSILCSRSARPSDATARCSAERSIHHALTSGAISLALPFTDWPTFRTDGRTPFFHRASATVNTSLRVVMMPWEW